MRYLSTKSIESLTIEFMKLAELVKLNPAVLRTRVMRSSLTLDVEVRIHLRGDEVVDGRATTLATDGALVVDLTSRGGLTVNATDVEHLR